MEILLGLIGAIIGAIVGALLTYFLGIKQLMFQNNLDNKVKMYETLFNKIRNLNSETNELNDLACNAQLYASDKIIDFLHKQDFDRGINEKAIHDLLVLIRTELGLKKRILKTYIHKMN